MSKTRTDGRGDADLRPVEIETEVQTNPEGSVAYRCGGTRVLISASIDDGVQDFLRGTGRGWVTGEYAMHPRANRNRQRREGRNGRLGGRTQEIQRLIGRSLRAAVRLDRLGERTITVDCDVLDADGGTRTASVTGGFIALSIALDHLRRRGLVQAGVLREPIAAISVGLLGGRALLDLCYVEDRDADVDLNLVASKSGGIVEVQGTAEGAPMTRKQHDQLMDRAMSGIETLCQRQSEALAQVGVRLADLTGE